MAHLIDSLLDTRKVGPNFVLCSMDSPVIYRHDHMVVIGGG
jgi:hypothetical protein